jgi:hypothetical protein
MGLTEARTFIAPRFYDIEVRRREPRKRLRADRKE